MHRITLRHAEIEDSEFVFNAKQAALGQYVAEIYGWDEEAQRALHARRFRPSDTQIVVRHGEDVGVLTLHREPDCIYLRQLFILPQHQQQGIGSFLVGRIVAESDDTGQPVALQVLKNNPRARTFYKRFGFTTVGETETHHQMRRDSRQAP